MPASERSLALTEAYRARTFAIRERLQAQAERIWPTIESLDGTDWPQRMATAVAAGQIEAVRATAGYLTAFLTSETGRRVRGPELDSRAYAGVSRDGRPLSEALRSPLIGTFGALKEGKTPQEALKVGLNRATRTVGVDFDHSHRTALRDGMEASDLIEGWQRAVRGTCGACAGDIAVEVTVQLPSKPLMIHPNCQCVTEPVVVGRRDRFPRLTGAAIFAGKSQEEQDEMLGAEAAEQVRRGELALQDLAGESEMAEGENWLTQKPLGAAS